ncbi:hypothetical protein ACJRO7_005709 [Eucalyptus globulus]|uniref:Uncharacterized protein n=1 Tax=Eucalyptus globulus TaxID=34317 RepID=A0ABD3J3E9_EUCGL
MTTKKLSTATEKHRRDKADYDGGRGVSGQKEKYLPSPKFEMGHGRLGTGTSVRPVMTWNLGLRGFSFGNASLTRSDKEIIGRHIEWGFIIGASGLTMRDVARRWWGYVGRVWWWLR